MSEPQNTSVEELMKKPPTPLIEDPIAPDTTATTEPNEQSPLTGSVKTLKDAFPDVDVDVIEAILQSQGGHLEAAFEVLLGMSDPTYKPEPQQQQQQQQQQQGFTATQLRQDEEYARQLAASADTQYNTNNSHNNDDQSFNFQEKVMEVGTAAKNKIMGLYNQFIAPPPPQHKATTGGLLETDMGNLSLTENNNERQQQLRRESVDLYEWDGREEITTPHQTKDKKVTSTSATQLMSDEEYARQIAREEASLTEEHATTSTSAEESPKPNDVLLKDEADENKGQTPITTHDKDSNTLTNKTVGEDLLK